MRAKTLFLTSVFLLSTYFLFAQTFVVPIDFSFKSKEDYAKYEKDIIDAAKWLEATPVGKEENTRQKASAFLMTWLTGSPTVTITLSKFELDLVQDNPQLLMMFMAGYAKYVLENSYSKDRLKATVAGVKSMINLYNLGGDFKKNKTLKKALEKDAEGKLEEWISEKVR